MNMRERDALRKLQDRFLEHPGVRRFIDLHGADEPLWSPNGPTVNQVRQTLFPGEREFFQRFLNEED